MKRSVKSGRIQDFVSDKEQFIISSHFVLDAKKNIENNRKSIGITSRNNASTSNYGGGFRCKSEYPWCIIEFSKTKKKK
ncbi:Uncharacterized protein FWK35_00018741 [Aphis craccivora]|uniref:Uncharacterized protein n=1 Tax=Aphis craccivora TaxID=307492 RepID=A0A6G0YX20_APHCR|nr:Uncharacterized protein FWK35_00018741 [Aphis craccivora]